MLDRAEAEVARLSGVVGIGVGLHPGYNFAHRLYAKRGYIPDARGITYRNRFVEEGESVVVDDDLVMHFTKQLPAENRYGSGHRRAMKTLGAGGFAVVIVLISVLVWQNHRAPNSFLVHDYKVLDPFGTGEG